MSEKYCQAIESYKRILLNDDSSDEIFYNLGSDSIIIIDNF